MSDAEVRASFVPSWRTKAREFNRRPTLIKQLVFLSVLVLIVLPLRHFAFHGEDNVPFNNQEPFSVIDTPPPPLPPPVHKQNSNVLHHPPQPSTAISADTDLPPSLADKTSLDLSKQIPSNIPDPMVFSLIIWGEDSAAEGAILLKSILMYTSGPVDFHIICNEEAQVYLEKRLALVKRPRYTILVRFYRPTWQDMLDRIEREGTIHTTHAAGTPGLMKLFIHEILPPSVKKAVFVDTDAYFISDPYLLWDHFLHTLPSSTVISMPTHPEMFAEQWFDANKICSCIMLLDLEGLRRLRLMDSSFYRSAVPRLPAYSPPAFRALFGSPSAQTGKYEEIALGDQSFWWAIIKYMNSDQEPQKGMFEHLHYDWEISSCLADMYITNMLPGQDDATEDDELKVQLHTWATPHQGEVIEPKLVHFNCLPGPRYYEWPGWDSAEDQHAAGTEGLARRWGVSVKYHLGFKWLWLNRGPGHVAGPTESKDDGPQVTTETVANLKFADQLLGEQGADLHIH